MADTNKPAKTSSGLRSGPGRKRGEDLSNYVFGKVQPQAVPLEEAVLGAVMLDKEALVIVLDILRPESFYIDAHQLIYRAMMRLFERSQPIDLLTVMEELKKSGDLEGTGGPAYLAELTNKIASSANIEYHSRIIAQKYIQRELINVSTKIVRDAFEDTTDVFELLDDAEQGLFAIAQQNMSRGYDSMSTLASKALKQLEELKDKKDGLTGVPTGFTDLDRLTSGFQPSDLIIIAARPGMGKCLGKGTMVLMYDGQLKKVEEVVVGDRLMGDDSTPRRVLSLARGREKMYWIRQKEGIDYRVNESHILSLKKSCRKGTGEKEAIIDIAVKEYLARSEKFQADHRGYKVPVAFAEAPLPLPPYFLGRWLGNGAAAFRKVAHQDEEMRSHPESTAGQMALGRSDHPPSGQKAPLLTYANDHARQPGYSMQAELQKIGVWKNKHIPPEYLINSRENRLQLLAGLVDGTGRYLGSSNAYEITQTCPKLARQIQFLGDSLGYRVSWTSTESEPAVYQLRIYGDIDQIPVILQPQTIAPSKNPIDWRVTDIHIEEDIVDDYYGFEIDGNRRFLLEDMTVTHNTSFTLSLAKNAAVEFGKGVAFFSLEMSSLQLAQRVISMEAEISGMKMRNGQLEEYEWQQLHSAIERIGEAPIFIDDTPGINVFELRAKCRRLKMQHDIQLIVIDYLQLMSGGGDNQRGNREQEVSAISRALKGLAKELEVPVIALSQLSRAVEMRGGTKRPQLSDLRESGCLTGDTRIQDADSGKFYTIKELADREEQKPIKVLALNEEYQLRPYLMSKAFYSGKKKVYELKTRTGRIIKASANHPFRLLAGWTPLDELKVGDKVAVPRVIEIKPPSNLLAEDEIILIAHLIGDGCILPRQPYHYTSTDPANLEVVNEKVQALFSIEPKIVKQKNWWHTYFKSPYHLTHGVKHPITKWFDHLGIERVRSYKKKVPNGIFQCDNSSIALFLHHLWATDGNISWKKLPGRKKAGAIYYSSTSKDLINQVQHLLLRLNILSTIRIVKQGKHRDGYHLLIQGAKNQLKFLKIVGCYGDRGMICNEMIGALKKIETNPNTDVIPKEGWSILIKPLMKEKGISQAKFAETLGIAKSSATYRTNISRKRLNWINQSLFQDKQLDDLANSTVLWDEIISITPLGVEDVYDATVPGVHNFVANDIIVHNSIEQDADMVSFIYRPEYYQILEDEEGQSLKGVAELIIAKNRHGALKTVKLKFTDEFARFSDLDDISFDDLPGDAIDSNFSTIITRPSKMNDDEDIPF